MHLGEPLNISRIAKEFNKRHEDFIDLHSHNDYLEEVEEWKISIEARILAHRKENAALIELDVQREEQYAQALKERKELERKEKEQRALELRRKQEIEREERETAQREITDRLETSTKSAAKVIVEFRAEAIRRSPARSTITTVLRSNAQLLRARAAQSTVIPDPPHVPLQDDWYAFEDLYTARDHMTDCKEIMRAGGYRVEEAWDRALRLQKLAPTLARQLRALPRSTLFRLAGPKPATTYAATEFKTIKDVATAFNIQWEDHDGDLSSPHLWAIEEEVPNDRPPNETVTSADIGKYTSHCSCQTIVISSQGALFARQGIFNSETLGDCRTITDSELQ
ncbi:hypothetical protein BDR04DRAFT_1118215 [Suillus decipiens]|nr:hypothetical protein BDR04DRAFT_1118215 [Suillus decipiens]